MNSIIFSFTAYLSFILQGIHAFIYPKSINKPVSLLGKSKERLYYSTKPFHHAFASYHSQLPSFCKRRTSQLDQASSLRSQKDESDLNESAVTLQPNKEYFATCIPGLSEVLAEELVQIGAGNVRISGPAGVHFTSNDSNDDENENVDIGMKALMYVRTAHRIMEFITSSESEQSSSFGDNFYDNSFEEVFDNYEQQQEPSSFINNRESLYNFIQQSLSSSSQLNLQNLLGNGKGGLFTFNISIIMNNAKHIPKDLCHSHYTSLTVKNAIVDMVRDMRDDGIRPDVDLDDPDVPFMVVVKGIVPDGDSNNNNNNKHSRNNRQNNRGRQQKRQYGQQSYNDREDDYSSYHHSQDEKLVHVSLYRILHSGGSSLHRRGYRSSSNAIHKAAMKESLASGLLLQAGWDKLCHAARYQDGLPAVLIDPMCGSGTFCVEAAMIASTYAPGLMRMKCFDSDNEKNNGNEDNGGRGSKLNPHKIPPVVRWKNSNRDYWKKLVLEARDSAKLGIEWMKQSNSHYNDVSNCVIMGNEMNPNALDLAHSNAMFAGFDKDGMISLHSGDCIDWEVQESVIPGRTIIVSNPPWGLRLDENIEDSWLSLKSFLREQCNESEAWVLSGSKSATRYLRMKKTRSTVIKTADEDLRWIQYHVFKKKEHVEER